MDNVVNLRMVRKARRRAEADAQAQENRLAFGRAKTERQLTNGEKAMAARRLDGHKRDDRP